MDGYIYVGGALGNSGGSRFCPVVAKFDKFLTKRWAFRANLCTDNSIDSNSYAVDMMYADHMNDHIYGVMVPRDYAGNLVLSVGYKIFKTRGGGTDSGDIDLDDYISWG
jgi:hypothetical protein